MVEKILQIFSCIFHYFWHLSLLKIYNLLRFLVAFLVNIHRVSNFVFMIFLLLISFGPHRICPWMEDRGIPQLQDGQQDPGGGVTSELLPYTSTRSWRSPRTTGQGLLPTAQDTSREQNDNSNL